MFDDGWSDTFTEWLDELLRRVATQDSGIRLGDAAAELRAATVGGSLDSFDDDYLARMIDESVARAEGFGVVGARDDQNTLVDPVNGLVQTSAAVLYRRKFSHRITSADVAARSVPIEGPLGVLDFDVVRREELNDSQGNPLARSASDGRNFGVPDFVEGFDEGRVLVGWREADQVHFEVIDDAQVVADGAAEFQAIADRIQPSAAEGIGANLNDMMFDQVFQDPASFSETTPPIDELLRAGGFNDARGWWGREDLDWKTPGEAARASRITLASQTYGLQRSAQEGLARLHEIWREWSGFHTFGVGESPQVDLHEIGELLSIEKVPLAFFDMHEPEPALPIRSRTNDQGPETAFDLLAAQLLQHSPDSVAALLMSARSSELHGHALAAEQTYRRVLQLDEMNGTALVKSLNAAVDAGRFDDGARLVRRLSGADSTNERMLQSYAQELITAGRNEPCPCGSGRKYKQCHQDMPLLAEPIATRALILKLEMYAEQTVLNRRYAPGGGGGAQAQLVGFPEARDFMIHEGGLLERFVANRGELLSSSDLERLRSWQMGRRDLYEIVDVDPGVGMTLRNRRTDEVQQIVEHNSSREAVVGQLLLLRLETINGVTTSYGQGVLVPEHHGKRVLTIMDQLEIEDLLHWFVDLLTDESGDPTEP